MIKINLLAQRKKVRRRSEKGQQSLLIGLLAVLGAGVIVFFLIDQPLAGKVKDAQRRNAELTAENNLIKEKTQGLAQMRAAVRAAEEREEAIERLRDARAVPAWMLWELSNILTRGGQPSITPEMERRLQTDPNRQLQETWDPKHVWIVSLEERRGNFRLVGGAQSDSDMTQLALRLQASMFFEDVQPEGGNEAQDRDTGVSYYQFTLSGKVRY
jgi:type IV pilus assembly protein PilN